MNDSVAAAIRQLATDWMAEGERRRLICKQDAVADTLDWCAGSLVERVTVVTAPGVELTVDEYARDYGATPQTVRNWIRRGELKARRDPNGWKIPRAAIRQRRARREDAAR